MIRSRFAVEIISKPEYRAPINGQLPLPNLFTRSIQKRGGSPVLLYELDYHSYEDYAPTADDFRLEKRYGLTTPEGPQDKPRPGGAAGRSNVWLWAVLTIVVSGAIGFVILHWRKAKRAA